MSENTNETLQTDVLLDRSGIVIEKDKRGMVCYFSFTPSSSLPKLTKTVVKATLKKAGVVFGLINDEINKLDDVDEPVRNVVVARGSKPVFGGDPHLRYRFPIDPYKMLKRAGKAEQMNYRDRGQLPFVKRGEALADIVTDGDTQPGKSILGEDVDADLFESSDIEPGKNVSLIGNRMIAQMDGAPRLNEQGKVEIYPEWIVDGDVDIRTGNIVFPGPVHIKGDIQPGFMVKAKSIHCRGVENKTQVECEGELIIDGGILGGNINCGGRLTAKFVNNANVIAGGDVEVGVSIINTELGSAGKVSTQTVFGGSITAKDGVDCVNLSSEANRTTVIIGVDPINQENISNIIREKIDIEGQIHYMMEKSGDALKFYDEYKKKAEEIKVYVPERDSLVQRLEVLPEDDKDTREFFEARLAELSEILDPVEKELKEGKARFANVKKQYMNEIMKIERLKKRLADLEKQQDAIKIEGSDSAVVIPKLYVKGKALMGTKISSTNARVVLQRDYNRVVFFQRKVHEKERRKYGNKQYVMSIDRL